jgi:hypothetical protein
MDAIAPPKSMGRLWGDFGERGSVLYPLLPQKLPKRDLAKIA